MFIANLPLFQCGPREDSQDNRDPSTAQSVSVLIPARDEAAGIERCVTAALASDHVNIQVIVLDDHSTDATAQIVQRLQSNDDRVKYVLGGELPDGWNGKQYACKQLSEAAEHDELVFMDADVRLKPHALHQLLKHKSANQFTPQVADQITHQIAPAQCFSAPRDRHNSGEVADTDDALYLAGLFTIQKNARESAPGLCFGLWSVVYDQASRLHHRWHPRRDRQLAT